MKTLAAPLRTGSVFTGCGGLDLGLEKVGVAKFVWQCEINPSCRAVLRRHWRDVMIYPDVREIRASKWNAIDMLVGGFPCQNVSTSGKGEGLAGEQSGLWFEYARLVEEFRPAWAIVENVAGGKRRWLPHVRRDLHMLGYRTRAFQLSAFDCGAPHERERVFVLASDTHRVDVRDEPRWRSWAEGQGSAVARDDGARGAFADAERESKRKAAGEAVHRRGEEVRGRNATSARGTSTDTDGGGKPQPQGSIPSFWRWTSDGDRRWTIEPPVCPVAHGVPNRMALLKMLGNSVSPQQSAAIGRILKVYLDA